MHLQTLDRIYTRYARGLFRRNWPTVCKTTREESRLRRKTSTAVGPAAVPNSKLWSQSQDWLIALGPKLHVDADPPPAYGILIKQLSIALGCRPLDRALSPCCAVLHAVSSTLTAYPPSMKVAAAVTVASLGMASAFVTRGAFRPAMQRSQVFTVRIWFSSVFCCVGGPFALRAVAGSLSTLVWVMMREKHTVSGMTLSSRCILSVALLTCVVIEKCSKAISTCVG